METPPPTKAMLTENFRRKSELAPLKCAVLPLVVAVSLILFFELIDPEVLGAASLISGGYAEPDPAWMFKEQRMRLLWGGSVIVWFATGIAATAFGFVVARSLLSPGGARIYLLVGLGFSGLLAVNLMVVSWLRTPLSALYFFPHDALAASGFYSAGRIALIGGAVALLNGILCIAPVSALLGGCSALLDPDARGEALKTQLERQMRHLRGFLNVGSMLLVASILNLSLWLHWPSVLIADPELARAAAGFASAVSLFWGAAASMLIASFYLPAYMRLSNIIRRRAAEDPIFADDDFAGWMAKNGMAQSPMQRIPQFATLIAPLLAAPLTDAVTGVSFV